MKIGVICDSMESVETIKLAIEVLNSQGLEYVVHVGNLGKPENFEYFSDLNCRMIGVFGPQDKNRRGIAAKSLDRVKGGPLEYKSGPNNEMKLFVYHGFEAFGRGGFKEKGINVIINHDDPQAKIGMDADGILWVNPGSLSSSQPTLAIVELETRNTFLVHLGKF